MMDRERKRYWQDIVTVLAGLGFAIALGLLTSCRAARTVETVRTETRTDTLRLVRVDSVVCVDSVLVSERMRGDTVFIYKERVRTRWSTRVDTVWRSVAEARRDSVSVPYPEERKLSKWERACVTVGKIVIGLIPAFVFWVGSAVWCRRKIPKQ